MPPKARTCARRTEDFVRVLALESVRNRVTIVGEDLGTVEPAIRETLARFGILSYRLFFFEKNKDGQFRDANEYPAQALVSSTTHDLPTLAGFWTGADIEARRRAGVIDEAAWREQWELRSKDKQKMLDRLFAEGLLRPDLPRAAAALSRMDGRTASCGHRISGAHALATPGDQSGGCHEGTGAAESAGNHVAVSELGPQDAIHGGGTAEQRGSAQLRRDGARLDREFRP